MASVVSRLVILYMQKGKRYIRVGTSVETVNFQNCRRRTTQSRLYLRDSASVLLPILSYPSVLLLRQARRKRAGGGGLRLMTVKHCVDGIRGLLFFKSRVALRVNLTRLSFIGSIY